MKHLLCIGSVTFCLFCSCKEYAWAQNNAAESDNSLFNTNNTALGNNPLNNSGNFNNNITDSESSGLEENFSLQGNEDLFLDNSLNQNDLNTGAPQNAGSAPQGNPIELAPNNPNTPNTEAVPLENEAMPAINQMQSAPLQNEFVDPFATVPGQNAQTENFPELPPDSSGQTADPLGTIDVVPLHTSPTGDTATQGPPQEPATAGPDILSTPTTTSSSAEPSPEAKTNGMTATEREIILQKIAELKPREPGSYPEEYIVQPGDTLWDISDQLLGDPFWWPKLWSFNSSIMNPHIIEPGMKIIFEPSNGLLPATLAVSDQGNYIPTEISSKTFSPERNALADAWKDLDGAIINADEIPESSMIDLYESKTIVSKNFVQLPGFVSSRPPQILGRIANLSGQGISPVRGGFVYSERTNPLVTKPGDRFVTIRPKEPELTVTGEQMAGQFWAYTGIIGVVKTERSGHIKFLVEDSQLGVQAGDLIVPYENLLLPFNSAATGPSTPAPAVVAAIGDGERTFAGLFDVVQLVSPQGNSAPGLQVGDLVKVYSNPGGLPAHDEGVDFTAAGLLRVVALRPEAAAAVVVQVKQEIVVGSSSIPPDSALD